MNINMVVPRVTLTKQKGFTLIEVVVSLAIFAVLTLSGWQVFNNLIKVRERAAIKTEQLTTIQEAYEQVLRDLVQAIPRPATIGASTEAAFLLQDNTFHLTRTGVIDPLQMGVSPMQRVYYKVERGELVRYDLALVDQSGNAVPNKTVLLNNVTNWSVNALSTAGGSAVWPADAPVATNISGDVSLPAAVEMTFSINDQPLRWVLPLATNLPTKSST
jgi:general secretion pathway protein J